MDNKDAMQLSLRSAMVLSQIESNGFRIDETKLKESIAAIALEIASIRKRLLRSKWFREVWEPQFQSKANINSRAQLGTVLFDSLGYQCEQRTPTGRPKVNQHVLESVDHPFVRNYLRLQKLEKIKTTYLLGIQREIVDGYLHGVFNLHLTDTFRTSSDSPNLQNIPVRDADTSKYVRSLFVPRDNSTLVEVDYSAIEVRIAACYHEDPTMIEYIETDHDLHKEMAAELYSLPLHEVSKAVRQVVKGSFVFAAFYGSYYAQMAPDLWRNITREQLVTVSGCCLFEHLKSVGIEEYDLFEQHVKRVEDRFWNQRFRKYSSWKRRLWNRYQDLGRLKMLSGFPYSGVRARNEVLNAPVQGAACHVLLWSICEIQNWLNDNQKKSVIVGTVHDSVVLDIDDFELDDVLKKVRQVMTQDVRAHFKWINVPLEIEAEASKVSWYAKESIAC